LIKRLKHLTHTAKTHQGFRRYFANTSWMFAEQMLRMVAGLFVGIWVARYLGPEQFGVFSYVLAFSAIFTSIAKLGLDTILVRELVNEPAKRDVLLGTAFWLKFISAIFVICLITLVLPLFSGNTRENHYIYIITIGLVFQSFEVVDFYFQSQVVVKFVSVCRVLQLLLSSGVKIYLMLNNADLMWIIYVSLFDQITLAIFLCVAYFIKNISNLPIFHFELEIAKKLLKDSWPLILSSMMVLIYMRIDQLMIKEMLGEREVGVFSAAVRLSEVCYFIPVILVTSLFPAILNAKNIDENMYLYRLQRLYTFLVWVAVTIAIVITVISDWLVILLYGEVYHMAGSVLKIHIWTSVFVFLGVASGRYLVSENLQYLAFWRTASGAIINVGLNMVFIRVYGIVGVAVATLISQVCAAYLFDLFHKKTRTQFVMKSKSFLMLK